MRRLRRKGRVDGLREALRYREIVADDEGVEWDVGVVVRVDAADALADFDATDVAGSLAEALGDPEPAVRVAVVAALSRLGTPTAIEPLVDCAIGRPDGDDEAAERALELLVAWELQTGPEVLFERLLEPEAPPPEDSHRDALERLLGAAPDSAEARDAVADAAILALRTPASDRAEACAETILGWLGPPVAERVLEPLADGAVTPALVRASGLLGDARIVEPVIGRLSSDDAEMRRSAAAAAGALNHTLAVPALLTATQDAEQSVRDAASAALNRMGMAAVIAGLAEIVRTEIEPAGAAHVLPAEVISATREALAPGGPAPKPPAPRPRRGGLVERLLGNRNY